jgi:hypothetical protein
MVEAVVEEETVDLFLASREGHSFCLEVEVALASA